MTTTTQGYVRVAKLAEVRAAGCLVVAIAGYTLVLVSRDDRVYALDNRCPHMGFPLHRGSVHDGILTCHWHHARFDLATGGTFDPWADDVPAFATEIRNDEVWVDLSTQARPQSHFQQRLCDGLEQNLPLVIAKAVIALLDDGVEAAEPFRSGLDFGVRYRQAGWGVGLTMHTCLTNLLPWLDPGDRPWALFHGLSAVARDCAGAPPRFATRPLPGACPELPVLQRWFRQLVAVRDTEGAERCLVSAVRSGADVRQVAALLFSAVTDYRYLDGGHALDFTNKALEALDVAGWDQAELVLASLVSGYTRAERMEESNTWRHPVDLVAILDQAFAALPAALAQGQTQQGTWSGQETLLPVLLAEDAQAIADVLLAALREGCVPVALAGQVVYAAALRIARFHTSNDFGDWDTAHHTFTFANAVQQGLQRVSSLAQSGAQLSLLRGVFDAAMSTYLNRFLNVPAVRLPTANDKLESPDELLKDLPSLLDRQQQVNETGQAVASYLYSGGSPERLLALLGRLLLREDRDFHTIQMLEVAFRQQAQLRGSPAGIAVLVAAARYLAAHAPTLRSQWQTYQMAERLHRGDHVFEEA